MVVPQGFQCNIALQSQQVWQYGFQIGHWSQQGFLLSLFGFPSCCIQNQNCLQALDVSEQLHKADIWLLPPLLIPASSLNTHDFRFCGCLLVLWANMVGIALSFNNTLDRKFEIKIYHLTQKMEILVKTVIQTFITFLFREW